ncbi:MAG TPA: MFS transporter [Acidimicrobiales bacterium]|nr:MFS transporter [Acidimicrobiales bacterium]
MSERELGDDAGTPDGVIPTLPPTLPPIRPEGGSDRHPSGPVSTPELSSRDGPSRGADPPSASPATPLDVGVAEVSWRSMVAALEVPAFRWYWAGQLLSGIGTWSQAVAQSWLVLDLTHSAVALGTITMLQFLPVLALALVGGVIADRVGRRQLLVATQVALTAQAVTLGVLVAAHVVTLWEVGLLALALGTTNALNNPAQQAFVPELVGRDLLADAVALNSVQFNTARMLGGAVGGLAIAAWGIDGALFLNAASFLPIVVVLAAIRPAHVTARSGSSEHSALAELRQGLAYAFRTTPVRRVVALFAVVGLLGFNWQVAVPLLARFVLHRSVTGFGDLMAAIGAGSLLAAAVLARDRRATEGRLTLGALALGAVLIALGLSRSYPVSLVLLGLGGIAGIVTSITANTRLQLLTPDHLRGRVMGIYVLLMGGTTPIGAFVLGELAGHLGTGVALVIFGATTAVAVGAIGLRRARGAAEGATE